jgi:membrane protein implicated in regulation of membrane protease activity
MGRRDPREARFLGLWTSAWLGALLLAGLLRLGDVSLQWPVLVVPVLWALVAARPRAARTDRRTDRRRDAVDPRYGQRTDTVERPALRPPRRRDADR